MAHFAELNEDNIVTQVIVVSNDDILDDEGNESEEVGINFLEELFGHRNWKQTSYNGNFRKRYGTIGFRYHEDIDGFSEPQPYPSWTLDNETLKWVPPVPMPKENEGKPIMHVWNEEIVNWDCITIEAPPSES
jgi:hypothetical protein